MAFFRDDKVQIIAELSCNHLQDYDLAVKTIEAMAESGVDIVKVQNDDPNGGITIDCNNSYFQIKQGTLWDGETLYSLYQKTFTPWEWLPKLQEIAHRLGMEFFSTPSDPSGVDFLEKMNVPAYKISSFEITDTELIKTAARTGKPIIFSTGIATIEDIERAIAICQSFGNKDYMFMKCTSSYPAPIEAANLLTMQDMKRRFGCHIGLSDHSMGDIVATTAVALGAEMIEKHFILDRSLGGPDAAFSMEPHEFKQMVQRVREAEKALGRITYDLDDRARNNRKFAKSIFVVCDIKKGEPFTRENIGVIRPGDGLMPYHYEDVLGKVASCDIERGTPLAMDMINKI